MKGLDFSVAGPLADESDHSSDDDSDGDEAVEVDDDESDEGEMPIDTPKKPAKPAPEPPKVIDAPLAAKKEEVKKAVASLATSANAVGPSPQAGTGSLVKGKNGVLVSWKRDHVCVNSGTDRTSTSVRVDLPASPPMVPP